MKRGFLTHLVAKNCGNNLKRVVPYAMLAGIALLFAFHGVSRAEDDDHKRTAITACGTVITNPGRYFLANDLKQCPDFGVSIAVSDVALGLRGHTIQGAFGTSGMITVNGGSTGLSNIEIEGPGTVTGGGQAGIAFENVHHSRVHNLVVVGNFFGIGVNAGDFTNDQTIASTASTDNEFRDNVTAGNFGHGITVNGGNHNRFTHNNLSGNGLFLGGHGLFLFNAKNNVASHNTTDLNSGAGIDVGPFGSENTINDNTALGNFGFDLQDENGDCVHNTWTDNSFNSNSPACIQ